MSAYEADDDIINSSDTGRFDIQPVTGEGSFYALDGAFGPAPFGSMAGLFDNNTEIPSVSGDFDFSLQYVDKFNLGFYQGLPLFEFNLKAKFSYGAEFTLPSGGVVGVDNSSGQLAFKIGDTKLSFSTEEVPGLVNSGLLSLQIPVFPGVNVKFGASGQPWCMYVGPPGVQGFVSTGGDIGVKLKVSPVPVSAEVSINPSLGIGSGYFARDTLDAFLQMGSTHLPPGM